MKRLPLVSMCLLLLVLALPSFAADRADEVRATEIAFAKAFAERDSKKFFSYLADDAQFLGRQKTLQGKQEVIAGGQNSSKQRSHLSAGSPSAS